MLETLSVSSAEINFISYFQARISLDICEKYKAVKMNFMFKI